MVTDLVQSFAMRCWGCLLALHVTHHGMSPSLSLMECSLMVHMKLSSLSRYKAILGAIARVELLFIGGDKEDKKRYFYCLGERSAESAYDCDQIARRCHSETGDSEHGRRRDDVPTRMANHETSLRDLQGLGCFCVAGRDHSEWQRWWPGCCRFLL